MPDRMKEIEAEVKRKFETYDRQRAKLIAAYRKEIQPKRRLLALAKVMRAHHAYMNQNMLLGGWQTDAILDYANVIEEIANDL